MQYYNKCGVRCIPKVGSKVQYGAAGHDQGVGSSFIPAKEPGTWGYPRGEGRTRGVDTPYLGKRGGVGGAGEQGGIEGLMGHNSHL